MQTLKNLCKALIIVLCTLSMYSCSNNDELDISDYKFQSIKWKLNPDDTEKINMIELPPKVDSNMTDQPMYITYSIEDNIEETSQFYSDDLELFNSLTSRENILVPITTDPILFNSEYKKLSSNLKAPLKLNETILPSTYTSKETIKLHPHTKMRTVCKIYIKEYTATYLATFANDNGETIEMSGKWKGAFNKSSKVTHTVENIE